MPSTTSSNPPSPLVMAVAARQMQLQLRGRLLRDVTTAWPALNFDRLSSTWPGWLQLMTVLLTRYHDQAARLAALHYLAARQAATGSPDGSTAKLAPALDALWLDRALGYAAPGMFGRQIKAGESPQFAARSALTQVLGTSTRIALNGARATITDTANADPVAVGFYRVTDGHPCAFCALMASRGVVYKTAAAAGVGSQWHNDCGCTVAPAFDRNQELPAISQTAARVYSERGDGPALAAFRKAWADHQATVA